MLEQGVPQRGLVGQRLLCLLLLRGFALQGVEQLVEVPGQLVDVVVPRAVASLASLVAGAVVTAAQALVALALPGGHHRLVDARHALYHVAPGAPEQQRHAQQRQPHERAQAGQQPGHQALVGRQRKARPHQPDALAVAVKQCGVAHQVGAVVVRLAPQPQRAWRGGGGQHLGRGDLAQAALALQLLAAGVDAHVVQVQRAQALGAVQ